jgi:hypothetical protein
MGTSYLLLAEAHHAVDDAGAEHEAAGEETADAGTENDWDDGDSRRDSRSNVCWRKLAKHSQAVDSRPVPQRSVLDLTDDCADMIDAHATERRLNRHHNESNADLEDASNDAADIGEENG